MSIHGRWADAILDGRKQVEFRKRRLASDIETVLVYATAPVSKIVGSFTIDRIESGSPADIWERFGHVGVIPKDEFFSYYEGAAFAFAIVVSDTERFDVPIPLDSIEPRPAVPQSFAYLPAREAIAV
ncbi:MAG: hypothetical protein BGO47_06275 [Microbacterium sp. 67-17]|jgi:predicted transcriptional regulator|uniref:ASCH domain-containing protein n=1 Tax=Microbacterium sp. 67-17 TaxID=1895782 RepID=UPI00096076E3|nr:ASCH domain-containing protein [Microbacterium sp. 67-17]OJV93534.1 MAG: hypothetical protein BGO47_06275 [Microbacterium sp. 67-17]